MVAKFNSKTHLQTCFRFFEPFGPRLTSKKSKYDRKKIIVHKNAISVSKNAEFYADLETVNKAAKRLLRKK
jgi:hypothetical protein